MKIKVYVDYDKKDCRILEQIYFKRPMTRHTDKDVVSKKAFLILDIRRAK